MKIEIELEDELADELRASATEEAMGIAEFASALVAAEIRKRIAMAGMADMMSRAHADAVASATTKHGKHER